VHYGQYTIPQLKAYLHEQGVKVRLTGAHNP